MYWKVISHPLFQLQYLTDTKKCIPRKIIFEIQKKLQVVFLGTVLLGHYLLVYLYRLALNEEYKCQAPILYSGKHLHHNIRKIRKCNATEILEVS